MVDDEVVSNVSLNTMELIIDGIPQKAIQIGTVMTHPNFRRQGLAYQLLKEILEDYDELYDLFFLAAEEEALHLYKKCGFIPREENKYIIDVTDYKKIDTPLKPLHVTKELLLDIKKQALPLSNILSAIGDEHVLMIYYILGFNEAIYQPLPGVYTIFIIKGKTLNLFNILSDKKVNLQEIIERITPSEIEKVFCHFTPDQPIQNLNSSIDTSNIWMTRTNSNKGFPMLARYPRISQT